MQIKIGTYHCKYLTHRNGEAVYNGINTFLHLYYSNKNIVRGNYSYERVIKLMQVIEIKSPKV